MKWLVLGLVVVNLALWYVFQAGGGEKHAVASGSLPRVSSLKLPERNDGISKGYRCVRLGWFETPDAAMSAGQNAGVPFLVKEGRHELAPLNWILIPFESFDLAREELERLQSLGGDEDAYIVASGEYRNAISLGLFESLSAAESVLAEKKRKNPDAVLAKFPRNRIGYALVFRVEAGAEIERLQAVEADTETKIEFVDRDACKGVASLGKSP